MINFLEEIFKCNPVNQQGCPAGEGVPRTPDAQNFPDLASVISPLLAIAIFIAAFLTFYYLIWGAWAYIFAAGDKENLAKARERIKWALIGLLFTIMAYTTASYAGQIFPPGTGGLPF